MPRFRQIIRHRVVDEAVITDAPRRSKPAVVTQDVLNYDGMTYNEIRQLAVQAGINGKQSKAELIKQLKAAK